MANLRKQHLELFEAKELWTKCAGGLGEIRKCNMVALLERWDHEEKSNTTIANQKVNMKIDYIMLLWSLYS